MNNANKCLEEISTWAEEHQLTIAPEKTEAVITKGDRDSIRIMLDGLTMLPKKAVRYFGVIVDERAN